MSWQVYVDSNLLGTGKIKKAAILGKQGGIWAASSGYALSQPEQAAVVSAFSNLDNVRASGVRLAGRKFLVFNAEGRSIYGRDKGDGVVIVQTKQAILVTEYAAPIQAAEATFIVEQLADYLIGVNY